MNLLPIDQLNIIKPQIEGMFVDGKAVVDTETVVDTVLDLLVMAYVFGHDDANETLGEDIQINTDDMQSAIYKKVADKTFAERVAEHTEAGDIEGIFAVAETDSTRRYNEAVMDTAHRSEKQVGKRWQTMEDERVRDTHSFLQGVTVGLDERFYTYDGDSARAPGDFALAENNVNCRCYIELVAQ